MSTELLSRGLSLEIGNLNELFRQADEAFAARGYPYMIYAASGQTGLPFFETRHSTTPDSWRAHYEANDYYFDDPIVREFLGASKPFLWTDIPRKGRAKLIMDEAEAAGLTNGLTIPIRGDVDGLAAVSLSGRDDNPTPDEIRDLEGLALTFNSLFHRLKPLVVQKDFDLRDREIECLQWVAVGKTSEMIAEILGIKKQTVDGYIRDAILKLGAKGRPAAVVKALINQIIVKNPTSTPYK